MEISFQIQRANSRVYFYFIITIFLAMSIKRPPHDSGLSPQRPGGHVFPAKAEIQNNSPFLLDPGLRRGDDEYQNPKFL
jgi:hypothetical protein